MVFSPIIRGDILNRYKLSNTIKKKLLKRFSSFEIVSHRLSYKLIHDYFKKYALVEWCTDHFCCYGEDKCCWQDIENSWILNSNKYKDVSDLGEKNQIVYSYVKRFIKGSCNPDEIRKRIVFVCEKEQYLWVVIPLRDKIKQDVYLIFAKDEQI